MLVWIVVVGLLIVLAWVTQLREGFISDVANVPDPRQMMDKIRGLIARVDGNADASPIIQKMQGLLNKYDSPENLGHVLNVKDKDPGELARMYLNITN